MATIELDRAEKHRRIASALRSKALLTISQARAEAEVLRREAADHDALAVKIDAEKAQQPSAGYSGGADIWPPITPEGK